MLYEIVKKIRGKGKKRGERYSKAMFGGFRHRYIEICAKNKLDVRLAEKLVSHTSKTAPMDKHYVNINNIQDSLFNEFLKIEQDLTISDEERLMVENKSKDVKIRELEEVKDAKIRDLERKVEMLMDGLEGMKDLLVSKKD